MNPINSSFMQESTSRQRSSSLGRRAQPLKTLSTDDPNTPMLIEENIFTESPSPAQDDNQPKHPFNFEKLRNTLRVESNSPFRIGSVSIKSFEIPINKSYHYLSSGHSSKHIPPLRTDHLSTEDSFRSNHQHIDREFTLALPVYDKLDVSEFLECSLDSVITHRLHANPKISGGIHPDKGDINITQEVSQFSNLIDLSLSLTDENVKANSPRESFGNNPITYSTIETLTDNKLKFCSLDSINHEEWSILGRM